MNLEYKEAVGEVLEVLAHTERNLIDKIPKKMLEFWKKNSSYETHLNFENVTKIEELNLKPKSKALLGMIYRNYWCDFEERKEYDEVLRQNEERIQRLAYEEELSEKTLVQSVEKDAILENESMSRVKMILYKENLLMKMIQKIKNLLTQNNQ